MLNRDMRIAGCDWLDTAQVGRVGTYGSTKFSHPANHIGYSFCPPQKSILSVEVEKLKFKVPWGSICAAAELVLGSTSPNIFLHSHDRHGTTTERPKGCCWRKGVGDGVEESCRGHTAEEMAFCVVGAQRHGMSLTNSLLRLLTPYSRAPRHLRSLFQPGASEHPRYPLQQNSTALIPPQRAAKEDLQPQTQTDTRK